MKYDELARIEANYGCVAEYYRCMNEAEEYEPTEEEIAESERQIAEYNAEIARLNGTESEFIHSVTGSTVEIVQQVADHYGVTVDEKWETFYRVPEGKFAISVEYIDGCRIYHKHIGNLTLEQFKDIFRDLHYARLYPTMSYKGKYVSNCSLGALLRNYIND